MSKPPSCHGFRCDLGQCLPANKSCDGIPDCRGGEDENPQLCYLKETQCHLADKCGKSSTINRVLYSNFLQINNNRRGVATNLGKHFRRGVFKINSKTCNSIFRLQIVLLTKLNAKTASAFPNQPFVTE